MPKKGERFHLVPYDGGWRVMADNGTFYSNKPLTKTRARAQQRALYAKQRGGEVFHGGSYTVMCHHGQPHLLLKGQCLEGEGFLGDAFTAVKKTAQSLARAVTRPVGMVVGNIAGRVGDVAQGIRNDYPPSSRKTIAQYGEGVIESLALRREPIQSFINKALDFVTMGRWSSAKKELNYDKLFHLSLVATLRLPDDKQVQVLMEKNEVINITPNFSANKNIEYMVVPVECCITLAEFLQRAQQQGGPNYFLYDAFKANCQMFLKGLLDANGLSTERTTAFILQPVEELLQRLPSFTGKFARAVTDLGGLANVAVQGRGEGKPVTMSQKDYFAEHKDIVGMLEKTGKTLIDEAKTQAAEAAGMRRKLEGKAVRTYGGVRLVGQMMPAVEGAGFVDEFVKPFKTLYEVGKLVGKVYKLAGKQAVKKGGRVSDPSFARRTEYYRKLQSGEIKAPETKPNVGVRQADGSVRFDLPEMVGKEMCYTQGADGRRYHGYKTKEECKQLSDQGFAEWEAKNRPANAQFFRPAVAGLTKVADFAVKNIAEKVGVPKVVTEAYKAFAPPGSEFYKGGTRRENVLKRLGLPDKGHSLAALAKATKVPKAILQEVYNRGIGAYKTNPQSVRLKGSYVKNVDAPMSAKLSKQQWAMARVYSFLDGNDKHDEDLRANKEMVSGSGLLDSLKEGLRPLRTVYEVAKLVGKVYKLAGKQAFKGSGHCGGSNGCMCGCGAIRSKFAAQLSKAGINPKAYLDTAKAAAKREGYDPKALEFSDNDTHKLMITAPDGRVSRFGRVGYGDFAIWSKVKPEIADKKRATFQASHSKIKGDWKSDKFSPNMLALKVLW